MRRVSVRLLLYVFVFTIPFGFIIVHAEPVTRNDKPIVIVISLDGFPARALKDPKLPMPELRLLATSGAVADAMQPINPTVTWPNHTALITGVDASSHFVMANGLITFPPDGSAPEIKPWVDKDKLVHARTLYEAAKEKGLTTAQVDWVAIYGAKGVDWQFGEKPDPDGAIERELIAAGAVTREQIAGFTEHSSAAWRDEIWTDAAIDILRNHTPNLLLLHLLETDTIQHEHGPLNDPAYAAYAYADACIERVVDEARKIGILDRTTFFIVSDHGFATYHHTIEPNAALAQQSLLRKDGDRYLGNVWAIAEGGAAQVFIRDETIRATLVPQLKAYFSGITGVEHVYTNVEARALGLPADSDTSQAPQLYLVAARDYAFGGDTSGPIARSSEEPRGAHGYLNTNAEMQTLFVASGAGIRAGMHLETISNMRVAPTIAAILGVQLPSAAQHSIDEILR